MRPSLACALLVVLLGACKRDASGSDTTESAKGVASSTKTVTAASASAASSAASSAAAAKIDKRARTPKKTAPKALSADETAALARYRKAMDDGRKATRDSRFIDADAAFDRALAAAPDDARAYSERGYLRVVAGDFKRGLADLDLAAARTKDAALLAQIWFNDGLAAEGLGDVEKARAAFARSNALRPTKAAAAKLAGKFECTATFDVDRRHALDRYDDWKSAYEALRADDAGLPEWKGNATLVGVCGDGWKVGEPCVFSGQGVGASSGFVLLATSSGALGARRFAEAGGRCGGNVDATIEGRSDGVLHVRVTTTQGITVMVHVGEDGVASDCGDLTTCQSACGEPSVTFEDLLIDESTGGNLLDIVREARTDATDPLTIARSGRTVDVKGAGCDRTLTLTTEPKK